MVRFVNVDEQIYTHEYLWRSSTVLLEQAQLDSQKSNYYLIPSLLMSFLAFEAFINFCGQILVPDLWANEKVSFQGKGIEGKVGSIIEKFPSFQWLKGNPPYQNIKKLENFRNMTSHGAVIATKYVALQKEDGTHFKFDHPWDEYITIPAVVSTRNDVFKFSESILVEARKISDEPHFIFAAYQGSLATALSTSKLE